MTRLDGAVRTLACGRRTIAPRDRLSCSCKLLRTACVDDYIAGRGAPNVDNRSSGLARNTCPIRADVAVTVFLSDPQQYEGGELVVETSYGEFRYKGDLGDCVVYPASTFHRVNRVCRGTRVVAVLWVQSMIRDAAKRQILYDIGCAIEYLDVFGAGGPDTDKLRRCYLNLVRN